MKTITKYEAFDGVEFASEDECRAHERKLSHARLVGLTREQVEAAMTREDVELADVFEIVGSRIAALRRSQGSFRRVRNGHIEEGVQKRSPDPLQPGQFPIDPGSTGRAIAAQEDEAIFGAEQESA
jgi:hypothetical protein